MSDKTNIFNNAASLNVSPAFKPFTGVRLWVDSNNYVFAGDESGRVLEEDCPWATQEMAENTLKFVQGYVYQPFEAGGALVDPAAELGDGITVGGVYGPLSTMDTVFDAMFASDISAPANQDAEIEYRVVPRSERATDRKLDQTRALITKTAEEIKLSVEDLEKGLGQTLRVAADGVTITNANGDTLTIDGGQIDASKINTQDLNLSGAITFNDLTPGVQSMFGDGLTANDVINLIDENSPSLPNYIKSTYIDATTIRSPSIEGNDISVYGAFQTWGHDGVSQVITGYMGAATGEDNYGNETLGVALSNSWSSGSPGSLYVIVTNAGVRMQAGQNNVVVTSSGIYLNTENGAAYYNGVEINTGGAEDITVTPVWG